MTSGRGIPRAERFLAPVLGATVLLLAWAAVAHASGSGFVQAIGALVTGVVAAGMILPAFFARRLAVTCLEAPHDATSGVPFPVTLVAGHALRCTPLSPGGESGVLPGREPGTLLLVPPYRGRLTTLRVKVATAAPLGLLWWSVEREIRLPRPVLVAPRTGAPTTALDGAGVAGDGSGDAVPALTGDVRQIRDYRHGDSRRRVHWGATAHAGVLMVRESEAWPAVPVRLVVDLVGDPDTTEARAAVAMATVAAHLRRGTSVVLETAEQARPVVAAVSDLRSAGRQLARAGTNPYGGGRDGPAR